MRTLRAHVAHTQTRRRPGSCIPRLRSRSRRPGIAGGIRSLMQKSESQSINANPVSPTEAPSQPTLRTSSNPCQLHPPHRSPLSLPLGVPVLSQEGFLVEELDETAMENADDRTLLQAPATPPHTARAPAVLDSLLTSLCLLHCPAYLPHSPARLLQPRTCGCRRCSMSSTTSGRGARRPTRRCTTCGGR